MIFYLSPKPGFNPGAHSEINLPINDGSQGNSAYSLRVNQLEGGQVSTETMYFSPKSILNRIAYHIEKEGIPVAIKIPPRSVIDEADVIKPEIVGYFDIFGDGDPVYGSYESFCLKHFKGNDGKTANFGVFVDTLSSEEVISFYSQFINLRNSINEYGHDISGVPVDFRADFFAGYFDEFMFGQLNYFNNGTPRFSMPISLLDLNKYDAIVFGSKSEDRKKSPYDFYNKSLGLDGFSLERPKVALPPEDLMDTSIRDFIVSHTYEKSISAFVYKPSFMTHLEYVQMLRKIQKMFPESVIFSFGDKSIDGQIGGVVDVTDILNEGSRLYSFVRNVSFAISEIHNPVIDIASAYMTVTISVIPGDKESYKGEFPSICPDLLSEQEVYYKYFPLNLPIPKSEFLGNEDLSDTLKLKSKEIHATLDQLMEVSKNHEGQKPKGFLRKFFGK